VEEVASSVAAVAAVVAVAVAVAAVVAAAAVAVDSVEAMVTATFISSSSTNKRVSSNNREFTSGTLPVIF
jgi:hypothetical protein